MKKILFFAASLMLMVACGEKGKSMYFSQA